MFICPPLQQVVLAASQTSFTIQGLNHSTVYQVRLRAHTKAGPGPFSPALVCQTLALETGRPGPQAPEEQPRLPISNDPDEYLRNDIDNRNVEV